MRFGAAVSESQIVKKELEDGLVEAKVDFLFTCFCPFAFVCFFLLKLLVLSQRLSSNPE